MQLPLLVVDLDSKCLPLRTILDSVLHSSKSATSIPIRCPSSSGSQVGGCDYRPHLTGEGFGLEEVHALAGGHTLDLKAQTTPWLL